MARVVIISSSELEQAELDDLVDPGDELVVIVAAVEQSRLQWLTNDEDGAREDAREAAEATAEAAPTPHASVQVKPDPPLQLAWDAIREHLPERLVIALREGDDASWLEGGVEEIPSSIAGVPVTRVALR
ncbi:MAG: hypothetical protein ACRDPV_03900 [Gaiellaceae bacterium]